LSRYLVKSMAGETLVEASVGWHGVAGDRRWAFVRPGMENDGFPWLTGRQLPAMAHFQPRLVDPARPDASAAVVRTPSGAELDVADPALTDLLGAGVRLIRQDRGAFDTFPLSLITSQTIAAIGADLDPRRFRPNFLVDADAPFAEDDWVGRTLRIGEARIRIDKRDGRCMMVNIDPTTLVKDPSVLRTIATERAGCLGVYGTTVEPGRVAVGDTVMLVDR
jgi:uncharacterized protein